MPSDEFFTGMWVGALVAALPILMMAKAWADYAHKTSMASFDRASDLLSEKFDLFRDLHTAAMNALAEEKDPTHEH